MAIAACRVENRQPRLPVGVEPPGRDAGQLAAAGPLAVLAIDVQELVDRRVEAVTGGEPWTGALEPCRERVANAGQPLRPQSPEGGQAPVVGRSLEVFERSDAEVVVETRGRHRPDAGDRAQERLRVGLAAQAVQHRQASVGDEVADGA